MNWESIITTEELNSILSFYYTHHKLVFYIWSQSFWLSTRFICKSRFGIPCLTKFILKGNEFLTFFLEKNSVGVRGIWNSFYFSFFFRKRNIIGFKLLYDGGYIRIPEFPDFELYLKSFCKIPITEILQNELDFLDYHLKNINSRLEFTLDENELGALLFTKKVFLKRLEEIKTEHFSPEVSLKEKYNLHILETAKENIDLFEGSFKNYWVFDHPMALENPTLVSNMIDTFFIKLNTGWFEHNEDLFDDFDIIPFRYECIKLALDLNELDVGQTWQTHYIKVLGFSFSFLFLIFSNGTVCNNCNDIRFKWSNFISNQFNFGNDGNRIVIFWYKFKFFISFLFFRRFSWRSIFFICYNSSWCRVRYRFSNFGCILSFKG